MSLSALVGCTLRQMGFASTIIRRIILPTLCTTRLSPQTSLQAEYRYRETEQGDLQLRFSRKPSPLARETGKKGTPTALVHGDLSPSSTILGSFTHQDSNFSLKNDQLTLPIDFIDVKIPEHALSAELQHLFHSRNVNLISGAGNFYVDRRIDITVGFRFPPPFSIVDVVSSTVSRDSTHTNVYSYTYINALKHVTFTSGFSADFLSSDNPVVGHKAPFNPKFGITWNPFPATTVRAAAFKALKRTLITNQTLEPSKSPALINSLMTMMEQTAGVMEALSIRNLPKTYSAGGIFQTSSKSPYSRSLKL